MYRLSCAILLMSASSTVLAHQGSDYHGQKNHFQLQAASGFAGRNTSPLSVNQDRHQMSRQSPSAGSPTSMSNGDRFCMKNYLGKVNCIPLPNSGGH